ncbi:CRISPR-associated protein Cas4 [Alteribacillus iranensis]|uniref:CRISPR-associated exonuclease Cas4 n=1 Tax=Alteribacillus iranensis TaxID=930128 RepID=A0A1I2B865_9BACI|nr:CRISPR-associated protein Cas4 [Alteribacillus iranensis]SFE52344.1 CRISPR-associated exonuclease Cas4 [Alteribacillus iranensis]
MRAKSVGGIHLHYYALCKRKLWLYDKGIAMEHESDRVLQGSILHEQAYPRLQQKEWLVDDAFRIDAIDGEYIRETKISSKMKNADRLQMLYYLYQLENRGIRKKGLLSYTKEKRTEEVMLDDDTRKEIKRAIAETHGVLEEERTPKVIKMPYCKSCAYYSFCYAMEEDEE